MSVFVDTSALIAVLDRDDERHAAAKGSWEWLRDRGEFPVCHNYILVETAAVLMRRFGPGAVHEFEKDIVPVLKVVWVTRDIHAAAVAALLAAGRRGLSLVDCASFEVMRRAGMQTAFAYDPHFAEFGYATI
ncbi:MAG TPA: PIN domain-containing protein [Candidatus Aminicenantes bacterium]|nr:PIN domain-containing protein [Candidatus Aminicenantes bacterium]